MKKKHIFLFIVYVIFVLGFSICTNTYAVAKKTKSYSLVVSGAGIGNGDKDEMTKIFQKNKLYSDNSVWTFTYDTEDKGLAAGTTKESYNNAIDTAYKECTINDTAYFFHSGHGMEGFTKGWGLVLKSAAGVPVLWYEYDDLLKKLSNVTCKHMVVIIHACESGAVKEAYDKLPSSKKKKISLFWSSAANQLSYKSEAVNVSIYGQTLIQLLGYDGNLYADTNNDGNVTVKELGDWINKYIEEVIEYYDSRPQTPGFCSENNLNTIIYSYNTFTLNKTSATIYKGSSLKLSATYNRNNKKVTWKSSDSSVATVSSNGKVVGNKAGIATITAKYNGLAVSCKVTVKNPSIKLNKTKATIYTFDKKTVLLSATVKGASSKITWKSSNTAVATVDSKGKVTAKRAGKTIIMAKANGKTAICRITVVVEPTISLNKTKATLYTSGTKTLQLVATVTGKLQKVKWKSSNEAIAIVDSKGKVTAKKEGETVISATANGKMSKCIITVKKTSVNKKTDLRGRYFYCSDYSYGQKIHFYKKNGAYTDSVMEYARDDMPKSWFNYTTNAMTFNKKSGTLDFYCGNVSGYFAEYVPISVKCEWNSDGTLRVSATLINGMQIISGNFVETDSSGNHLVK